MCALLALSSTAVAQNISAEDFDLACAVTAGAIFGSNPKGGRRARRCQDVVDVLSRPSHWAGRQDDLEYGYQGTNRRDG
jgi:hypothetical protein